MVVVVVVVVVIVVVVAHMVVVVVVAVVLIETLGAGDFDGDRFRIGHVGGEVRWRQPVGGIAIKNRWGPKPLTRQIMGAARDGQKRGRGYRRQQRSPRRQLVGVVGDNEGAHGKHAVVPDRILRSVPPHVAAPDGRTSGRQQPTVGVVARRARLEQGLRDEDELLQTILNRAGKGGPRLSLPRVEPPPMIAFADEHIHEHPVPTANIHEPRERRRLLLAAGARDGLSSIHVLPQLDQEGGNTQILEDMFARFGLLHPIFPQPVGMAKFQLGVGILHPLLRDQLVMVHPLRVARQRALSMSIDNGQQMMGRPHQPFRQRERLRRKQAVMNGNGAARMISVGGRAAPAVHICHGLRSRMIPRKMIGARGMRDVDDQILFPLHRFGLEQLTRLRNRLVQLRIAGNHYSNDGLLDLKPGKVSWSHLIVLQRVHEVLAILPGRGSRGSGIVPAIIEDVGAKEQVGADVGILDEVQSDAFENIWREVAWVLQSRQPGGMGKPMVMVLMLMQTITGTKRIEGCHGP